MYYDNLIEIPRYKFQEDRGEIYGNLKKAPSMQKFLDKDPKDLLRKKVMEFVAPLASLTSINQTNRHIAIPNQYALQAKATYYESKYGIDIRLADMKYLKTTLLRWEKKITEPTYIGVIIGDFSTEYPGHVVSLLCYFNGKNDGHNEYLFIDCGGVWKTYQQDLEDWGIPCDKAYVSEAKTQVDLESCRTASIYLLRNALLSLKHNKHSNGFSKALQNGKVDENKHIIHLPPEWDYTEQISNKLPDAGQALLIRHLYSKKVCKRDQKITVQEHRERFTSFATYVFTLEKRDFEYSDEFRNLPIPSDIINLKAETHFRMEFTLEKKINHFLFVKGLSQYTH